MRVSHLTVLLLILAQFAAVPVWGASSVQYSVTVAVVPNAPSNLAATAASQTQVLLAWTDNSSNEEGFIIQRKIGSGAFSTIASTTSDIATFTDNTVSANTSYSYRVAAFLDGAFSAFSSEATTTTPSVPIPPPPSGGGGGGGGGIAYPSATAATVTLRGQAYPGSDVTILKDAEVAALVKADGNAHFEATISNLSGGNYAFSVWAQDASGLRSVAYSFIVPVAQGATTIISGILLPPTIFSDKISVKRGDLLKFFGYSAPNANVTLLTNSDEEIQTPSKAASSGYWFASLDTSKLEVGRHSSRAKASIDNLITTFSDTLAFDVGEKNQARSSLRTCPAKGDFNTDCRVNLIDFSILAYWYKRPNPPPKFDLNKDSKISLPDFSILAFFWTG